MVKQITNLKVNRITFLIILFLLYMLFDIVFVSLMYSLANVTLNLIFVIGLFAIAGAGVIISSVMSGDVDDIE